MQNRHINRCIEAICQHGCQNVNSMILALEQGQELEETRGLSNREKSQVLAELRAVMKVYNARGCEAAE